MTNGLIGRNFGAYWIREKIGSGGMASVFEAAHKQTLQKVALKILHEQYNDNQHIRTRFEHEAKISARLEHPHIVPIWDYGEHEGHVYLVMPLMEGGSLAAALSQPTSMRYSTSLDVLSPLADALDYAHNRGVIHRDFKLENILLDSMNVPAISDFGIAQAPDVTSITMTGQILGSPQYLAPESLANSPDADYRLDLYAFAVTAYLLLTGYFPFTGSNALSIIDKHRHGEIPLPGKINASLPPILDDIFLKALAKDPEHRFGSAHDFTSYLETAFRDFPVGAVTVFLNAENPLSHSNIPVTPPAIRAGLSQLRNADIPQTIPADFIPRADNNENPESRAYRKVLLPVFVGGLIACSALALNAQSVMGVMNLQAAEDRSETLKEQETPMATESSAEFQAVSTESSPEPSASQADLTDTTTATGTLTATSTATVTHIQSLPTRGSISSQPNLNPTTVNLPDNNGNPQPVNPQPQMPNNSLPTAIPPSNVPPTNPPPTVIAPTAIPPTSQPTTVVPTSPQPTNRPTIQPTDAPPTRRPATNVPPTTQPTTVPATNPPPTAIPPTEIPATNAPPPTTIPTLIPQPTLPLPTNLPPPTLTFLPPTEDNDDGRGGRGGRGNDDDDDERDNDDDGGGGRRGDRDEDD